jgi:uncharacterized protein
VSILARITDPTHWVNRIVYVLAAYTLAAIGVSLFATIFTGNVEASTSLNTWMGAIIPSLLWIVVTLIVILEERRQPSGSTTATGIIPTQQSPRLILRGILWGMIMLGSIAGMGLLLGGHFELTELNISPLTVAAITIGAVGEEVLFRSTILRVLNERFGSVTAILVTSTLFALAHTGNPSAAGLSWVNTFLVAIILATVVLRSGSIWTAAAFHVVWNLMVALCFGSLSGLDTGLSAARMVVDQSSELSRLLFGDSYGIESGLACTLSIIISFAFLRHIIVTDPYVIAARYRISFTRTAHSNRSATGMELTNGE